MGINQSEGCPGQGVPESRPAPPGSAGAETGKGTLQTFNEITGGIDFCGVFLPCFRHWKVSPWGWGRGQKAAVQRELYWILSYFIF